MASKAYKANKALLKIDETKEKWSIKEKDSPLVKEWLDLWYRIKSTIFIKLPFVLVHKARRKEVDQQHQILKYVKFTSAFSVQQI